MMAILEYLEETHRGRPCWPKTPAAGPAFAAWRRVVERRASVVVPRIRGYLEREMHQDSRRATVARALDRNSAGGLGSASREEKKPSLLPRRFADFADVCLPPSFRGEVLQCRDRKHAAVMRIFGECMKIEAFDVRQPAKQPDAPKTRPTERRIAQ